MDDDYAAILDSLVSSSQHLLPGNLTISEYLRYAQSVLTPWLESISWKPSRRKILLAQVFSAMEHCFPDNSFNVYIQESIASYINAQDREDVIMILDSLGLLPYVSDLLEQAIQATVLEIVDKAVSLSDGQSPLLQVITLSVQHSIQPQLNRLSIADQLWCFTKKIILESFINNRFSNLFDMIILFPDSQPAVQELASLLPGTLEQHSLSRFVEGAVRSCREKLLTPAMSTETIIGQFINGIPVFRALDHTGLLLDRTAEAARNYLLAHRDQEIAPTVYKLFCLLCDEAEPPASNNDRQIRFDSPDDSYLDYLMMMTNDADDHWLPDPPAAGNCPVRLSSRSWDHWSILANFSSAEQLLTVIHNSIAQLIVAGHTPSTKILKRISQVASRLLGKQVCSRLLVMLHDAQQSVECEPGYAPLVISAPYWPRMIGMEETPASRMRKIDGFPDLSGVETVFAKKKPHRRLLWLVELSCVDLDIVIDEVTYALNAVPFSAFQAIQLITTNGSIQLNNVEDLDEMCRRGILWWAERGFITIDADHHHHLRLVKPTGKKIVVGMQALSQLLCQQGSNNESSMNNGKKSVESQLIPIHCGPMVIAMLTNLGPLPGSRIHGMLVTMSGLRASLDVFIGWLAERSDVTFDPITGLYSKYKH